MGDFVGRLNIRILLLIAVVAAGTGLLIYRLFSLQIVNGEEYLNNFQLRIRREISLPAARGNIYDRNGQLLAYNELAYSVTIRDLGDTDSSSHNRDLNDTINKAIDIIEKNRDQVNSNFNIVLNADADQYEFSVDGARLTRFRADVYGHAKLEDLTKEEANASPDMMILSLAKRYGIGSYTPKDDGTTTFVPEEGYDKRRLLQVATIRYNLQLNSFKKYIATAIASDVSDKTVSSILENSNTMQGINIENDTVRRYVDAKYFAHILGYTGTVSPEELEELQKENPDYTATDQVGKSGIEKSLETTLQGTKGTKTVYVDNLGKELETILTVDPVAGGDVYLTIDKDLQEAAYDILEKKLSEIILAKIRPIREYIPEEKATAEDITIPIYTVYYQTINNNIISIDHFGAADASDTEKAVYASFGTYLNGTREKLHAEMFDAKTPYENLSKEMQDYESYIIQFMKDQGVLDMDKVNTKDETYLAWTKEETISMTEFLYYCISQNWIDVTKLDMEETYADSAEEFQAIADWLDKALSGDKGFAKHLYHYMILGDVVSGGQICQLLLDQNCVSVSTEEAEALSAGTESSYDFMVKRITNLDLTPAQLALDPCSGSIVITDVNTGDVLALVSYPSYDNNRMANGVDAAYYESLRQDLSKPLINYATQQRTAPGSTFKPISATAGLMEGAITTSSEITCTGVFTKIGEPGPRCWIYPAAHGTLNVVGGIQNSCNDFFYEVGWRLGLDDGGTYHPEIGVEKLKKYAEMYGLGDKSGIEIEEAAPIISSEDAVRSAIGQGNSNYTTVGLARYVTAVANSGTAYNLTLVDKTTAGDGSGVIDNSATIKSQLNMDPSYWSAIHEGMEKVVEGLSFDLPVTVAGKTGTAQENAERPNHALFIGYAPYDRPQIAVATRVANGYLSSYAAHITEDVLKYYYKAATKEELTTTTSSALVNNALGGD